MAIFLITPVISKAQTKHIEVDLTAQRLMAYQDNNIIYSFPISSGKTATPTPTGLFKPWIKMLFDRMIGPGYDLPNVPYVVYFYEGYAIHGTYWHNNFGHPMSHGCINLRTPDMKLLYNWMDYQTSIQIYGNTPGG